MFSYVFSCFFAWFDEPLSKKNITVAETSSNKKGGCEQAKLKRNIFLLQINRYLCSMKTKFLG